MVKEEGGGDEEQKEEQKLVCKVTIDGRSDTLALVFALDHRSTPKEMTRDSRTIQIQRKRRRKQKPCSKLAFSIVVRRYIWHWTIIILRL